MWRSFILPSSILSPFTNHDTLNNTPTHFIISPPQADPCLPPLSLRLLLAGVAGCVQFSRIPEISSVVLALLKAWGQPTLEWLRQALAALPDASASASDKQAMMSESGLSPGVDMGDKAAAAAMS